MVIYMKNLIFINGTMGVGKTATSKILLKSLPNCVFLDGDWCWFADPWTVTDETKRMMYNNTGYLLNSFLDCSAYENVIFCWVMHLESMINDILSLICSNEYNLYKFSLVCSEEALKARLQKDIDGGIRENNDIINRALSRLTNFYNMDTVKIDVSNITPEQAADTIYNHIYYKNIFLETERLYLRKYTLDDVEKNYLYSQEESRKKGIPNEVYADIQASRDNVEFILSTYEKRGFPYVYVVALKDIDEYIGHISLSEIPEGIEIGYAICEKHQGKGYATEIVRAYAAWGKRELGLEKIYGVTYTDNTASKKVLEKTGFTFVMVIA